MKRILYLTFYFRPDLCAGSFRNSPLVDELARQIKNQDIQTDVITTSPNRYSSYREEFQQKETLGNVSIERIVVPSHDSGIRDQIFSFKKYFFEALKITQNREYDLVFASSSRFFTSYLGYLIAKRNGAPLYLDIRDLFSETIKNVSNNPFIKYLFSPVIANREQKVYQYASHINLISEGFKSNFKNNHTTNFSYFTHGVDPAFQSLNKSKNQPGNNHSKRIIYAGNIGDGQGLHKIIPDAAVQLKGNYHFRIIGDGGAKTKLTEELRRKNIDNVELVDPMNRQDVIEEYRNADILFLHLNNLPVFKKVLPSKIFELAAVEKPVLAGVNGYARDFMDQKIEGTFLFDSGNVHSLLEKIKEIEEFQDLNKEINNKSFSKTYDRKTIKQEMVSSILSYLKKSS